MTFQEFELEAYQSRFEQSVRFNLADSGVKCVTVGEWLTAEEREALLNANLFYPEVNGTHALRTAIAALYTDATPENVLVTVGASQANLLVAQTFLEPGDEVVVLSPGYRQMWGLARNIGCMVREVALDPDKGWSLDLDRLAAAITSRTKLVSIVNPNNPTGAIFDVDTRAAIIALCAKAGAWLHADEVYAGTEFDSDTITPSFWGGYDRLVCVNSLSKAYGLAGLRIGWIVAAPEVIEEFWRRHEYSVIAAAAPSMELAQRALQPETRKHLLTRQGELSRNGRRIIERWIAAQGGRYSIGPATSTSLAFVRYAAPLPSLTVAEHIRRHADVLVAPSSMLGAEQHLRIAIGYDGAKLTEALDRIGQVKLPNADQVVATC